MKFYDRNEELKELERLNRHGSRMLVLYGKRRIGKTALIRKFLDGRTVKWLYLFVPRNTKAENVIREYSGIVKERLGLEEYESISTFEQLLKLLFDKSKKAKLIVAFDEFQNLEVVSPETIDLMQKLWDTMHKESNISFVITGSSVGMMKRIFIERNSPLFKRAYNMLELKEFGAREIFSVLNDIGIKGVEDRLRLYFLFGGVIAHYVLLEEYGVRSAEEAIKTLLLRENAPLKDTVRDDMIETFGRESPTYLSILEAIASGRNTNNEIAAYCGLKETSLQPYITDLADLLGAVGAQSIVTEKMKARSKRNRYFIKDNFYNFWFSFISRNINYYELGDFKEVGIKIDSNIEAFNGVMFEKFARELVARLSIDGKLGYKVDKIGGWWGNDPKKDKGLGREEIDIVAFNSQSGDVLFGECKWSGRKVGVGILNDLMRKAKLVDWHSKGRKEHFIIFSKAGFDAELIEKARKEDTLLVDINSIARILSDDARA